MKKCSLKLVFGSRSFEAVNVSRVQHCRVGQLSYSMEFLAGNIVMDTESLREKDSAVLSTSSNSSHGTPKD